MLRRLLSLGLLTFVVPFAPAGEAGFQPPVLPEVRKHLTDGWACLNSDPDMAKAHAMAVLVSDDVTVQVMLDKVAPGRRTACRAAIDEALESWEKALGNLKLHRAEDGATSGIVFHFQPDVRERGEPVAGYVNWKRTAENGLGSVTGDVQIRTVNLDGSSMSGRAMRNIAVHEMGHLLGLDDCDQPGSAMSPLDPKHLIAAPSEAEAAAVRALRTEATKLLNDAG